MEDDDRGEKEKKGKKEKKEADEVEEGEEGKPITSWECPHCTFENLPADTVCEMCNFRRSTRRVASAEATLPSKRDHVGGGKGKKK